MLNVIIAEIMKLKRNKLILTCNLIGAFVSILFILMNTLRNDATILIWTSSITRFCLLLAFSVLSSLIITFIIHREYTDNTIVNTLNAPVERFKYLTSKLSIWSLWHMSFTLFFLIIICIGASISYGISATLDNLPQIIAIVLKAGILNILVLLPVAWIAILQKKSFYPSLIFSFIVIFIGFIGATLPTTLNNLIPWCAVYQLSFTGSELLGCSPYISIILCGILGLSFAAYSIKNQEL